MAGEQFSGFGMTGEGGLRGLVLKEKQLVGFGMKGGASTLWDGRNMSLQTL